jgi:alpha-2-macroglobulin
MISMRSQRLRLFLSFVLVLWFVSILSMLAACGKAIEPETRSSDPAERGASVQPADTRPPIDREQARRDYAQTPFKVLRIGEQEWNGAPALAVTFSVPLDSETVLERHLSVTDRRQQSVAGGWMLDASATMAIFPFVEPQNRYQVHVAKGVAAVTGRLLAEAQAQWVETAERPHMVRFAGRGAQLSPRLTDGLEIEAVNVAAVDLDLWQVRENEISAFVAAPAGNHLSDIQQLQQIAVLQYSARFDLAAEANHRKRHLLPLQGIKALEQPGVWVAVMKAAGDYPWQFATTWFTVSDLGLHVRQYESQLLAWVHGLTDAQPHAQVEIQLLDARGTVLRSALSTQQGAVVFDGAEPTGTLVIARKGPQMALVSLQRPALDLSEFGLPQRPQRPLELFIYAPRDLYRPGETLVLNALLRDHDGRQVAAQPVQAALARPDGRVHRSFAWQADEQGFYTTQIALPADTLTGNWQFRATLGNGDFFEYPLHVEDFLPERMRLQLAADLPPAAPLTTTPVLAVHGEYLWGAPAAGNRLETTLRISAARKVSELYADFLFGPPTSREFQETLELPVRTLDETGRATLELPNHWAEADRPIEVQAIASLFESGGRPITRVWRTVLWPTPTLVGLRPLWSGPIADPQDAVGFELIHIDGQDRLLAADGVEVTLVRENERYYWRWSDDGWSRQQSPAEQTVYTRVVNWDEGGRLNLNVPVAYGQYRIELRDPRRRLLAAHRFFAGWRWDGERDGQGARPEQVMLRWDAAAYAPQGMATLNLQAPFDGHALITVEGQALLWQGTATVRDGGADIRIPVPDDWDRHDLYATALVLRSGQRSRSETDQRMPRRAWGMRHLPLERAARDMGLVIEAPEQVLPERRQMVKLRINHAPSDDHAPADDQPVAVTLAAVDTGVLSLTRFATPDPFDWFFGARAYTGQLRDTYGDLMEISRAAAARQRFGGDADLARGGDAPQSEVRIVALFSGKVMFDNHGEAEIPLDLPYFNGELRLMAVAFDAHRVGHAEKLMKVAAPLVAEINLPRFLALADRIDAVWDLQSLLPDRRQLRVELQSDAPLGGGQETRQIQLNGQQRTRLRLPVAAAAAEGQGELRLILRSTDGLEPQIAIDRRWRLGLRPPYPAERRVHQWMIPAGGKQALGDPLTADALPGTLAARLVIASVPPLDLDDHFQHLVQYPYGCLEQTSSRLWPLLLGSEQDWQRYGQQHSHNALAHNRKAVIEQAIAQIAGMQRFDGGFGVWRNDSEEAHWLTVYATDLLLTARQQGHPVETDMLEKALARIGRYLTAPEGLAGESDWYSEAPEHYRLAYRAYAALVLSGVQQARLSQVRQIYDQHAEAARSPLPLAQLALALERLGDTRRAGQAWQKALAWTEVKTFYGGDYGSPVRDLAWTLLLSQESQLLAQPDQQALQPWQLVFPLQQAMRDNRWFSTQEHMALYRLALLLEQRAGTPWTAELRSGPAASPAGEPLPIGSDRQWARHWGGGTWLGESELVNSGNVPLYVTSSAPASAGPRAPWPNGSPQKHAIADARHGSSTTARRPPCAIRCRRRAKPYARNCASARTAVINCRPTVTSRMLKPARHNCGRRPLNPGCPNVGSVPRSCRHPTRAAVPSPPHPTAACNCTASRPAPNSAPCPAGHSCPI